MLDTEIRDYNSTPTKGTPPDLEPYEAVLDPI